MRKAIAKRAAAFEACLQLRKLQHLDSHLLPTYQKQLPYMRNAHLALNVTKTNVYDMRLKPRIWESQWGMIPEKLYLTILSLNYQGSSDGSLSPLALLTRVRLPEIPRFPLHLLADSSSEVLITPIDTELIIGRPRLSQLTAFTLRIFKDIFNKTYEVNEPQMSYWLAPVHLKTYLHRSEPFGIIDWQTLDLVQAKEEIQWSIDMPDEQLLDRYLIDRWDGGRRFFAEALCPHLRPHDPLPEGCPAKKNKNNILDYTVSLFAKSRARVTWNVDQPVLKVRQSLHRRNWLDTWSKNEQAAKTLAYVCPEPLKISVVCRYIPSITVLDDAEKYQ